MLFSVTPMAFHGGEPHTLEQVFLGVPGEPPLLLWRRGDIGSH